jgi:hypothetical protein
MPLALLVLGTGVAFVWSALSGKDVWGSIQTVLSGGTLDTSLSSEEVSSPTRQAGTTTTAGGDTTVGPTTNGLDPSGHSVADLQTYARSLLAQRGWSGQWADFNSLVMSESGWRWNATNPSSGAYGIAQALPPSKYASSGADWKTNGYTQLRWMVGYVAQRYGSPSAAWSFHKRNNWY